MIRSVKGLFENSRFGLLFVIVFFMVSMFVAYYIAPLIMQSVFAR